MINEKLICYAEIELLRVGRGHRAKQGSWNHGVDCLNSVCSYGLNVWPVAWAWSSCRFPLILEQTVYHRAISWVQRGEHLFYEQLEQPWMDVDNLDWFQWPEIPVVFTSLEMAWLACILAAFGLLSPRGGDLSKEEQPTSQTLSNKPQNIGCFVLSFWPTCWKDCLCCTLFYYLSLVRL